MEPDGGRGERDKDHAKHFEEFKPVIMVMIVVFFL